MLTVTAMIAIRNCGPTTGGPAQRDSPRLRIRPRRSLPLGAIGTDRLIAEPLATVRADWPTLRATETPTTSSWLETDNTSTRGSAIR